MGLKPADAAQPQVNPLDFVKHLNEASASGSGPSHISSDEYKKLANEYMHEMSFGIIGRGAVMGMLLGRHQDLLDAFAQGLTYRQWCDQIAK
jgi:hypothetical protein